MGRKIPAKKHRGVKDPLVQQAKRLESLKGKINAPPRDPDEQPVPKSLLRLFGSDRPAARGDNKKVNQQRADRHREGKAGGDGGNPVAKLKRLPGESGRAFSRRITGAARALHDATDGQHYPMEEEEDEPQERWRRRKAGAGGERPTKVQRRKLVLQQRKKEQAEARSEAVEASRREVVYEHVPFGERADAPPALPAPRISAKHKDKLAKTRTATATSRPGQRELLLTRLLAGVGGGQQEVPSKGNKGTQKVGVSVSGVMAERQREAAEQRRLAAVAAYRAVKAQQRAAQPRIR